MKNACKSKYEYAKVHEQGDFVLPVLEVRGCDFDWKSFLDASGMDWNSSFALKRALCVFSVLKFLREKCKVGS